MEGNCGILPTLSLFNSAFPPLCPRPSSLSVGNLSDPYRLQSISTSFGRRGASFFVSPFLSVSPATSSWTRARGYSLAPTCSNQGQGSARARDHCLFNDGRTAATQIGHFTLPGKKRRSTARARTDPPTPTARGGGDAASLCGTKRSSTPPFHRANPNDVIFVSGYVQKEGRIIGGAEGGMLPLE